jgi:tripartite-type tricarboxylate transporter receptor subunit TctC
MKRALLAALLLLVGTLAASAQAANPALAPLAGRTIRIVIGGGPGSGTDGYARPFVDTLKEVLPDTTVLAQNVDGGGGALAYVETQSAAGDVITVVISHSSPIYHQMRGTETAAFDLNLFHWVGALTNNQRVVVVRTGLGATDYAGVAALDEELVAAVTSATSPSNVETTLLGALTDLRLRIIVDIDDDLRASLMMAGDVDLAINSFYGWVPLIASGSVVPILRIGEDGYPPEAAGLPTLASVVPPGTPSKVIEVMESLNKLGRLVGAAPSTPPEIVESLKAAFAEVVADPDFAAAYAARELALAPTDGEEVARRISLLTGDPEAAALLNAFYACGEAEADAADAGCPM